MSRADIIGLIFPILQLFYASGHLKPETIDFPLIIYIHVTRFSLWRRAFLIDKKPNGRASSAISHAVCFDEPPIQRRWRGTKEWRKKTKKRVQFSAKLELDNKEALHSRKESWRQNARHGCSSIIALPGLKILFSPFVFCFQSSGMVISLPAIIQYRWFIEIFLR